MINDNCIIVTGVEYCKNHHLGDKMNMIGCPSITLLFAIPFTFFLMKYSFKLLDWLEGKGQKKKGQ